MPSIDLESMSAAELKQLRKDLDKAIASYADRQRKAALEAAEAAAREFGFSLTDLAGSARPDRKPSNSPKYARPENPEITWSGRGRQPGWIKDALANGKDLAGFEIGKGDRGK